MDGVTTISALHAFDPITQRTTHPAPSVTLHRAIAGPLSTTETATATALARGRPGRPIQPRPVRCRQIPRCLHPGARRGHLCQPRYAGPLGQTLHRTVADAHAPKVTAYYADAALPYSRRPACLSQTAVQAGAVLAHHYMPTAPQNAIRHLAPAPWTHSAPVWGHVRTNGRRTQNRLLGESRKAPPRSAQAARRWSA